MNHVSALSLVPPVPAIPATPEVWGAEFTHRIESALEAVLRRNTTSGCPPRLGQALRYAVFPGGARIRPNLCLAVAKACGDSLPTLADAAAAAIEMFHCASLVHDDLPCFDDAECRRGKPALHRKFGEAMAVLAGDGMIVIGFKTLSTVSAEDPHVFAEIMRQLCCAVDTTNGIVAGQASELEESADIAEYHRSKTGALFEAAAACGSLAGGGYHHAWRTMGRKLGEAYQVADDISDVVATEQKLGKPIGRDLALGRPSIALLIGVDAAMLHLQHTIQEALDAIPACHAQSALRAWIASAISGLYRTKLGRD